MSGNGGVRPSVVIEEGKERKEERRTLHTYCTYIQPIDVARTIEQRKGDRLYRTYIAASLPLRDKAALLLLPKEDTLSHISAEEYPANFIGGREGKERKAGTVGSSRSYVQFSFGISTEARRKDL